MVSVDVNPHVSFFLLQSLHFVAIKWDRPIHSPATFLAVLARYHKPVDKMASARIATDSLWSIPENICVSFLPDSENISKTVIDRGLNKYFSYFFDDIKVFEPSEDGDSTVQVAARCYRSMRKNDAPYRLSFDLDTATHKIIESHCSCKAG